MLPVSASILQFVVIVCPLGPISQKSSRFGDCTHFFQLPVILTNKSCSEVQFCTQRIAGLSTGAKCKAVPLTDTLLISGFICTTNGLPVE